MMALASHLQTLEAEKQKYKAQVRRLCQENAWIRDELNSTQQQLRQTMQVHQFLKLKQPAIPLKTLLGFGPT